MAYLRMPSFFFFALTTVLSLIFEFIIRCFHSHRFHINVKKKLSKISLKSLDNDANKNQDVNIAKDQVIIAQNHEIINGTM